MHLTDPLFPPLLSGHGVKAPLVPFAEACRRAARGDLGAGDVVWARNASRATLAIVLEPEVPFATTRQMLPLIETAVADAIGNLMPAQTAVHVRWPATLLVNGGEAATVRMASSTLAPDQVPDWIVIGADVVIRHDLKGREPGELAWLTSLVEEGALDDLDRSRLIEAISAHVLSWLNTWQDDDFRPIHDAWIGRVLGYEYDAEFDIAGARRHAKALALDDEMRLVVRTADGISHALPPAPVTTDPSGIAP